MKPTTLALALVLAITTTALPMPQGIEPGLKPISNAELGTPSNTALENVSSEQEFTTEEDVQPEREPAPAPVAPQDVDEHELAVPTEPESDEGPGTEFVHDLHMNQDEIEKFEESKESDVGLMNEV